jgi:hypothetical protein
LLPRVSEICLPIQKHVEFERLGDFDFEDPAGTLSVLIDEFGLAVQRLIYRKDFTAILSVAVCPASFPLSRTSPEVDAQPPRPPIANALGLIRNSDDNQLA